ncbi:hypothetical protein EJ04DRAFT_144237 [Polyplosphaeria fusca]|uniref:Rhodopsin domain-containing protein n=1 Tax=Polyplosphaeria fusca TaxID=682080 RepID=A0A9P4V535_9PLEO|nr:hypothetical protein EJ04DRAFT_144237 [Polyplosphaeria fusca]
MVLNYTEIMVLVWVLWGTCLVMTVFRGSLQWYTQHRLHADDHFVFLGLISLTGLSVVITRLLPQFYLSGDYVKAAVKDPLTPLPLPPDEMAERTRTSLKLMFCQMLLFWTTLWSAKFSILFFFRRLVNGLPKYIRAWWASFVVVTLLYLACMLSNFLTCAPLKKYWSATGCSDPEDLRRSDASIKFATSADVVADLIIMILPLNLLRKLQISRRQKFGLGLLFSLGSIIVAFAFARLAQVTKATSNITKDPTTVANGPILLSMWSHIESAVSIIVATLPVFRYLLNKNIRGSNTPGRYGTPGYSSGQYGSGQKRSRAKNILTVTGRSQDTAFRLQNLRDVEDTESQTELKETDGITKRVDVHVEEMLRTPATRPKGLA